MQDGRAEFTLLLLFALCAPSSIVTHSLQYLYTSLTPGQHFPECTVVSLVGGEEFMFFDSNIKKTIPKTDWIKKINAVDAQFWTKETRRTMDQQENLKILLNKIMIQFGHTEGNHTLQRMYSCELDDDSTTRQFDWYGYDGEDLFSLDVKAESWTLAKPEAEIVLKEWDPNRKKAKHWTSYLGSNCLDWLTKFVSYGNETLERKVPPEARVFQKYTSSPELVCFATGFSPKSVSITWKKNGEDVYKDVHIKDTLPNQDGSFQKRSILKVRAEHLQKYNYTCVIQHSSLEKDLVLEAPKGGGSDGGPNGVLAGVIAGVVLIGVAIVVAVGYAICKKRSIRRSDLSRESRVQVPD